jgi:hypothetical protein
MNSNHVHLYLYSCAVEKLELQETPTGDDQNDAVSIASTLSSLSEDEENGIIPSRKRTDSSLEAPATCSRTDVVRINRSTQMRHHVVRNPDDVLARSMIAAQVRRTPPFGMDNVPEAFQERIGRIWNFLSFKIGDRFFFFYS